MPSARSRSRSSYPNSIYRYNINGRPTPDGIEGGQGRDGEKIRFDAIGCLLAVAVIIGTCIAASMLCF